MNTEASTLVRRPSLMNEGEPLLLARSAIDTAVRFQAFAEESGIPPRSVLSTSVSAMPLPIYGNFEGRRWPGTRPEYMWHPLMWLPSRVAGRYTLRDPRTGEKRLEDDDLWAIRVAFELTASGLYDKETGTWFDIPQLADIDTEDPESVGRIRRWLDGAPDKALDWIDLTDYLDIEPSSWALEMALEIRDDMERASWAVIADDLLDLADQLADEVEEPDPVRAEGVKSLGKLGQSFLSHVPIETEQGEPTAIDGVAHRDFFFRLHDSAGQVSPEDLTWTLMHARARLTAIRDAFWSSVDRLAVLELEEQL